MDRRVATPRFQTTWSRVYIMAGVIAVIRGCSIQPGTELRHYTRAQTLNIAPVAVLANGTVSNFTTNTATMTVQCVFKSPGAVPSQIYVHDIVVPHSCQANPIFMLGTPYVLALVPTNNDLFKYPPSATYDLYSPEVMTANVFYANEMVLEEVTGICGMQPVATVARGCPLPSQEVCTDPSDGAHALSYTGMLILLTCLIASLSAKQVLVLSVK